MDLNKRMELIEHFKTKCSMAIVEAEKVADMNSKLADELKVREVCFQFKKIDGTIRNARGTLMSDVIPEIKGNGKPASFDLQLYFDLDKQSFRCFKKCNLISSE